RRQVESAERQKHGKNPGRILEDHIAVGDGVVRTHAVPEPLRHLMENLEVVPAGDRASDENRRKQRRDEKEEDASDLLPIFPTGNCALLLRLAPRAHAHRFWSSRQLIWYSTYSTSAAAEVARRGFRVSTMTAISWVKSLSAAFFSAFGWGP